MDKIQKTICREELKSRICGLFAYLEENDAGVFRLHKATDSSDGCYGKIIENIKLPENVKLDVGNEVVLMSGGTYSYRTLMNYYYQYKDYDFSLNGGDNSFIFFIEKAIGKIAVNFTELGLNDEDNDLLPVVVYLANVRNLINTYQKLKVVYDYYTGGYTEEGGKLVPSKKDINTLEPEICCTCSKYVRMGGTIIYNWLFSLLPLADETATEYYGYADSGTSSLNFDIMLRQSVYDIGYLSCYLNEWVGGELHHEGELYTYNGNTYVCVKDNTDVYNKELMRFEFVEDDAHFRRIGTGNTSDDSENDDKPWWEKYSRIISSDNRFGNVFNIVEYDSDNNPKIADDFVLEGSSDSKLVSMRRFKTYLNASDTVETPEDGEDWLYYYRIGTVNGYKAVTDDLGNILDADKLEEGIVQPAISSPTTLAAYGNVITAITANESLRTITFEYVINAHLIAEKTEIVKDDDGNELYRYSDFIYDPSDRYHGVKYTETYSYDEGSELDELVKRKPVTPNTDNDEEEEYVEKFTFDEYVNDVNDNCTTFGKFAFNTTNSITSYNRTVSDEKMTFSYIKSDFTTTIKNEADYLFAEVYKTDYLNGITYKPEVENNVRIDRGNYSAFERHIKLSEVKTMEDMENYANNSFFNVQKTS